MLYIALPYWISYLTRSDLAEQIIAIFTIFQKIKVKMTQAGKVAEIFTVAGEAFTKLGTLAMSLQPSSDRPQEASKWGEEEIEMLRNAVKQFGTDVEKISNKIKTKSTSQIKAALKQKATGVKPISVSTPSSTLLAIPRPQITIQGNLVTSAPTIRQIGQKSKAAPLDIATIKGATSVNTQITVAPKKGRLDSSTLNMLASTAPTLNTLIRQNSPVVRPIAPGPNSAATIGLPVVASNQGFQVLVPPQQKTAINGGGSTVIPVSLLQTGIVQRVSNANTASNVDVES